MIIPAPHDVAFNLFGLPIYWYGITMACAIFFAMIVGNKFYNLVNNNKNKDFILEYAPAIILSGILGARFYFCLLNFSYYFSHPLAILDIRQGGLSIHGAIIAGILCLFIIARNTKIHILNIFDAMACSVILGQSIGRWGNYFNSEAYGIPVASQNWGLFIPVSKRVSQYADFSLFHPTFLYESILDFGAFLLLSFLYFKFGQKLRGITFFAYFIIYALIRFFVEQIRVDSALNIGAFPIAEIVSVVLFGIGVLGLSFILLFNYKKP